MTKLTIVLNFYEILDYAGCGPVVLVFAVLSNAFPLRQVADIHLQVQFYLCASFALGVRCPRGVRL